MKREFKGVWIPREIWLNENLSWMERLFLTEISSLDGDDGCYARNDYFADFFKLTKGRCSQIISSLEKKGCISIKYHYSGSTVEKRVINATTVAVESSTDPNETESPKRSEKKRETPKDDSIYLQKEGINVYDIQEFLKEKYPMQIPNWERLYKNISFTKVCEVFTLENTGKEYNDVLHLRNAVNKKWQMEDNNLKPKDSKLVSKESLMKQYG